MSATATGIRIVLHIQPRASKTEIVGAHGDALKIRLQAAPVDGAANEALIRFVAASLEVPRSAVALVAGSTSRRKILQVDGITPAAATARLNLCSTS